MLAQGNTAVDPKYIEKLKEYADRIKDSQTAPVPTVPFIPDGRGCPHCGYCPHCGRHNPTYPTYDPYRYIQRYTITCESKQGALSGTFSQS